MPCWEHRLLRLPSPISRLNGLAVNTYNFSIVSVTDFCGNPVPGAGISGNPQTIVVHALPDASGTTNNDPTICNNTATSITLAANIVGSTFTWNVVDADGAGAANGTGNIGDVIGQTLTNGTNDPIFVIYEITPARTCPSQLSRVSQVDRTVQIEPIPQAAITNNTAAVCHNGNVDVTITSPTNPTVPGDLTFDMIVTSTNDGALGGAASGGYYRGIVPQEYQWCADQHFQYGDYRYLHGHSQAEWLCKRTGEDDHHRCGAHTPGGHQHDHPCGL